MFHQDSDDERYFNGGGGTFRGPRTIQEHLHGYSAALREAAQDAAMALLAEESDDYLLPASL